MAPHIDGKSLGAAIYRQSIICFLPLIALMIAVTVASSVITVKKTATIAIVL